MRDQVALRLAIAREHRDAGCELDRDRREAGLRLLFELASHAVEEHLRAWLVGLWQYHQELVAAVAAADVGRAQTHAERRRDDAQDFIAGLMPECVVERLEIVEVEERDRERMAGAPRT